MPQHTQHTAHTFGAPMLPAARARRPSCSRKEGRLRSPAMPSTAPSAPEPSSSHSVWVWAWASMYRSTMAAGVVGCARAGWHG